MKPVFQTVFGEGNGNCLQAAVASILELPIEDVPHFIEADDWMDALRVFLAAYDLFPLCIMYTEDVPLPGYMILSGKSPRGAFLHSVVARNGKIVHDPHPDGTGLETCEDYVLFVAQLSAGVHP